MAVLSFKVQADYEKVVKLREEITKLETQLKSFGKSASLDEIKAVESKLATAKREFNSISTEAAKAGAVIDSSFKAKIYESTQAVNAFTEQIIEQKSVVKDVEYDVKKLGEAYQKALKSNSSNAPNIKADYDAAKKALEEERAALFGLTQEKAKATLATKKLKDEYKSFQKEADNTKSANDGLTLSLGKIAGLVGGVAALKQLGSQIVRVRAEFQDMETQIETLVGKDVTSRIMPQIKEMAKVSPLTMGDIVGAEKMMLSFNIEADKSIEYLKALSDVSMGNSQKFNSLTLAFSQMSSAGRLMGQDLLQMINAGFNPLQTISEKTGKSIAQLKEEMSKGAISAQMVQQAFLDATSAGGKFYNMSENASKTINGQISMMQDAMDAMFNEVGTKTEGIIIKGIQSVTTLVQNYEKVGKVLVGLVTTYGAYRTAIFLSTAATSKHTIAEIALTNVRIAARKAQQMLNAAMMTNPYVALATVVAGLATTMWALKDNTTAAEKAQERFDKRKADAAQQEQEHMNAIEGLINKANDESVATHKRIEALNALKSQYKNIFGDYDLEALKLANTRDLLKEVNAEYDRKQHISREQEYEELSTFISQNAGRDKGKATEKLVQEKMLDRANLRKEATDERVAEFAAVLEKQSEEYLQKVLEMANAAKEGKAAFQISDTLSISNDKAEDLTNLKKLRIEGENLENVISAINKEITNRKNTPFFSEDYKAAKTEWETAKRELEKIENEKDKFTTKQYQDAKARKERAEKDFKALGGDTSGKKEEGDTAKEYNERLAQQEKAKQTEERSAKERVRTAKDMEYMVEQARIDAMAEGFEKIRAQRELDNKKELDDIERRKQDYIDKVVEAEKAAFDAQEEQKAKNDDKYKKQSFDSEAARKRVEATDKVVKQYSTLKENTEAKQRREEAEELKAINDEILDGYKTYQQQRDDIAEKYAKKEAEFYTTDESGNRVLREGVTQGNVDELKRAQEAEELAVDTQFAEREAEYLSWMDTITNYTLEELTAVLEQAEAELEALEQSNPNDPKLAVARAKVSTLKNTISKKSSKTDTSPDKRSIEEWKDLQDALKDCISAFEDIGDAVGGVAGEVISTAGSIASSTLSMINGIVQLVTMSSTSMTATAATASTAISTVEKASVILAVISAALQIVMAIINAVKGAMDKDNEKRIAELTKKNEALDKSYEKLEKSISKAFSVDASNLIEQQNKLLEQKKANLKLMIAEENAKKNVDESQVAEWNKQIEEIDSTIQSNKDSAVEALAGQDVMSAIDSFANAYANAWTNGEDAATASMKATRDMIRNSLTEFLKGELSDNVEAFNKKLAESMKDGIIDPWEEAQLDAMREKMDEEAQNYYEQTSKYWEDGEAEKEEETQQEASRRGYETISEDTGNELVGRATAQYESNLRMEESMRLTKESVDLMMTGQSLIRDIAAESRALIADSFLELQMIRENTGAIIKPIKNLSDKMDMWNDKIMGL